MSEGEGEGEGESERDGQGEVGCAGDGEGEVKVKVKVMVKQKVKAKVKANVKHSFFLFPQYLGFSTARASSTVGAASPSNRKLYKRRALPLYPLAGCMGAR